MPHARFRGFRNERLIPGGAAYGAMSNLAQSAAKGSPADAHYDQVIVANWDMEPEITWTQPGFVGVVAGKLATAANFMAGRVAGRDYAEFSVDGGPRTRVRRTRFNPTSKAEDVFAVRIDGTLADGKHELQVEVFPDSGPTRLLQGRATVDDGFYHDTANYSYVFWTNFHGTLAEPMLYVGPSGSDVAAGGPTTPLATVEGAIAKQIALTGTVDGLQIKLAAGSYALGTTAHAFIDNARFLRIMPRPGVSREDVVFTSVGPVGLNVRRLSFECSHTISYARWQVAKTTSATTQLLRYNGSYNFGSSLLVANVTVGPPFSFLKNTVTANVTNVIQITNETTGLRVGDTLGFTTSTTADGASVETRTITAITTTTGDITISSPPTATYTAGKKVNHTSVYHGTSGTFGNNAVVGINGCVGIFYVDFKLRNCNEGPYGSSTAMLRNGDLKNVWGDIASDVKTVINVTHPDMGWSCLEYPAQTADRGGGALGTGGSTKQHGDLKQFKQVGGGTVLSNQVLIGTRTAGAGQQFFADDFSPVVDAWVDKCQFASVGYTAMNINYGEPRDIGGGVLQYKPLDYPNGGDGPTGVVLKDVYFSQGSVNWGDFPRAANCGFVSTGYWPSDATRKVRSSGTDRPGTSELDQWTYKEPATLHAVKPWEAILGSKLQSVLDAEDDYHFTATPGETVSDDLGDLRALQFITIGTGSRLYRDGYDRNRQNRTYQQLTSHAKRPVVVPNAGLRFRGTITPGQESYIATTGVDVGVAAAGECSLWFVIQQDEAGSSAGTRVVWAAGSNASATSMRLLRSASGGDNLLQASVGANGAARTTGTVIANGLNIVNIRKGAGTLDMTVYNAANPSGLDTTQATWTGASAVTSGTTTLGCSNITGGSTVTAWAGVLRAYFDCTNDLTVGERDAFVALLKTRYGL